MSGSSHSGYLLLSEESVKKTKTPRHEELAIGEGMTIARAMRCRVGGVCVGS